MERNPIRQLAGAAGLLLHTCMLGQTPAPTWSGDTADWHLDGASATLDAATAGTSTIRCCPVDSAPAGVDLVWRWRQDLAGSSANRSTLTAYRPAPDSAVVAVLDLGATGSADPLAAAFATGGIAQSVDLLPGVFAAGLDADFRWLQPPGSAAGTLLLRPAGTPVYTPLFSADGPPTCLALTAHFTASNTAAFSLTIESAGPFSPDTVPPAIASAQWSADTVLFVQFTEPLDSLPVGIWPGLTGALCSFADASTPVGRSCLACLPPPAGIPPGIPTLLRLFGAADTAGNAAPPLQLPALFLPPNTASPGDIAITEILADPTPSAGLPETEWAELTNFSSAHHDIAHLTWRDGTTTSALIPLPPWDGILPPEGRFLVSTDTLRIAPGIPQALAPQGGTLADDGERLAIEHADGLLLDAVAYERSWWQGAGGGHSISLKQRGACGIAGRWGPEWPATPGFGAEVPAPESQPLAVTAFTPLGTDRGRIEFDQALTPESAGCLTWRDANPTGLPLVPCGERTAEWTGMLPPSAVGGLVITGLRSCDHPWDASTPVLHRDSIGRLPRAGDLAVSEIAVQAAAGWPGQGPFVEWVNVSGAPLEVAGVTVNGSPSPVRWLAPGEAAVHPIDLPNSAGDLAVANGDGEVVEAFRYSSCWHAKRSDEDRGLSLERCDLLGPAADGRNWRTSAAPNGCTPGWVEQGPEWVDGAGPEIQAHLLVDGVPGVWLSEPVAAPLGAVAMPVSSLGPGAESGRAWHWPAGAPDAVAVQDQAGNAGTVHPVPPPTAPAPWRLHECLAWTSPVDEPFLETWADGNGWVESSAWAWSTTDAPGAGDWAAISEVNWVVPGESPMGWARCPQRLPGGRVLPTELPSLFGDRLVSLARWDGLHWVVTDTVWSARDRFDAQGHWDEGTSWERFHRSPGAWAASRSGHTAGRPNSLTATGIPAGSALAVSPTTCIPFDAAWGHIGITWSSEAPLVRLAIHRSDGERIRSWEVQALPAAGTSATWFWDGLRSDGLPAEPGPHWVVAEGAQGQVLDRAVVAVAPPPD